MAKVNQFEDIQRNIEAQNECIATLAIAVNSTANLLITMGELFTTGQFQLPNGNVSELAQAFKEVGYKINDQINNEDSHYPFSLIIGDCFDDTANCLVILEQIGRQCGQHEVRDIIQNFKILERSRNA